MIIHYVPYFLAFFFSLATSDLLSVLLVKEVVYFLVPIILPIGIQEKFEKGERLKE